MKRIPFLSGIVLPNYLIIPLLFLFSSTFIHAQIGVPTNPSGGNLNGYVDPFCNFVEQNNYPNNDPEGTKKFTGGTLEVAIDIDYTLYQKFGGNIAKIDSLVNYHMSRVHQFYRNRIDLSVQVVNIHYWTSQTPYFGLKTDVDRLDAILNYWDNYQTCIHRDLVIVLTDESIPGAKGISNGYLCNNSRYDKGCAIIKTQNPGDWVAIAHEIGHNLGAHLHTEQTGCSAACTNTCSLMCTAISCANSNPGVNEVSIDGCSLLSIKDRLNALVNKCYPCLDSIVQPHGNNSCESCLESVSISTNTTLIDNACSPNDTVILTIKACGRCNDTTMKRIEMGFASINNFVIIDTAGFKINNIGNGMYKDELLTNGSCKTYHVKLKIIKNGTPEFSIKMTYGCDNETVTGTRVLVNVRKYPIWNNGGTINGGFASALMKQNLIPNPNNGQSNDSRKQLSLNGELIIDTTVFLNNFEVTMTAGSKITVAENGHLGLWGCNLNTCGGMWKGIQVEEGGTLYMHKEYTNPSVTFYNTIEDAEFGINAMPNSNLSLDYTRFFNNYIGINIGFLPSDNELFNINLSRAQNLEFYSNGVFEPKYNGQTTAPNNRSYCGINLVNVPLVNLGGCTFKDMSNGIIAKNSSLNINGGTFINLNYKNYDIYGNGIFATGNYHRIYSDSNTTFSNMLIGMYTNGMQLLTKQMTFDNVNVGISSTLLDKSIFEVEQSTFKNINYYGIFGFRNGKVKSKIKDNNITITATNVGSYTDQFGMVLLSRSNTQGGWYVKNNTINVNKGKGGIFVGLGYLDSLIENKIYRKGIINPFRGLTINGTYNTFVGNNTIKNTFAINGIDVKGYHASGLNNGRLKCNRADSLGAALELNAVNNLTFLTTNQLYQSGSKALYYERGTIIGQQFLQGNRWFGTSEAYNNSIDFVNNTSIEISDVLRNQQFLYNQYVPNWYYPLVGLDLPQDVTVDWFSQISGTDATCSNPPIIGNPTQTEEFEKKRQATEIVGINGNNGHPLWNENTKWTAQSRLYDLLYQNPTEFGYDETLNGFMNTSNLNTMGAYASIRRWLNTPPTISEAAFTNNQANTEQVLQNLFLLDAQQANLAEPDTNLTQQQKTQLQNLANLNAQLTNQVTTVQSQLHSEGVSLLSQNTNLVAINTAQQNEKTLNEVVITQLATSNSQLDPNQVLTVASIAAQCPLNGGDAVYRARTILAKAYPNLVYNDAAICGTSIAQPRIASIQAKENNFELSIMPNPSNGTFELKYTMANEPLSCSIIGIGGNLIKKLSLDKNTNSKRIQLEDVLPNGIYQIIVQNEQQLLKSSKLVIIK